MGLIDSQESRSSPDSTPVSRESVQGQVDVLHIPRTTESSCQTRHIGAIHIIEDMSLALSKDQINLIYDKCVTRTSYGFKIDHSLLIMMFTLFTSAKAADPLAEQTIANSLAFYNYVFTFLLLLTFVGFYQLFKLLLAFCRYSEKEYVQMKHFVSNEYHNGKQFSSQEYQQFKNFTNGEFKHLKESVTLYMKFSAILSSLSVLIGVFGLFKSQSISLPEFNMKPQGFKKNMNKMGMFTTGLLSLCMLIMAPLMGAKRVLTLIDPIIQLLQRLPYATWMLGLFKKIWEGTFDWDEDVPQTAKEWADARNDLDDQEIIDDALDDLASLRDKMEKFKENNKKDNLSEKKEPTKVSKSSSSSSTDEEIRVVAEERTPEQVHEAIQKTKIKIFIGPLQDDQYPVKYGKDLRTCTPLPTNEHVFREAFTEIWKENEGRIMFRNEIFQTPVSLFANMFPRGAGVFVEEDSSDEEFWVPLNHFAAQVNTNGVVKITEEEFTNIYDDDADDTPINLEHLYGTPCPQLPEEKVQTIRNNKDKDTVMLKPQGLKEDVSVMFEYYFSQCKIFFNDLSDWWSESSNAPPSDPKFRYKKTNFGKDTEMGHVKPPTYVQDVMNWCYDEIITVPQDIADALFTPAQKMAERDYIVQKARNFQFTYMQKNCQNGDTHTNGPYRPKGLHKNMSDPLGITDQGYYTLAGFIGWWKVHLRGVVKGAICIYLLTALSTAAIAMTKPQADIMLTATPQGQNRGKKAGNRDRKAQGKRKFIVQSGGDQDKDEYNHYQQYEQDEDAEQTARLESNDNEYGYVPTGRKTHDTSQRQVVRENTGKYPGHQGGSRKKMKGQAAVIIPEHKEGEDKIRKKIQNSKKPIMAKAKDVCNFINAVTQASSMKLKPQAFNTNQLSAGVYKFYRVLNDGAQYLCTGTHVGNKMWVVLHSLSENMTTKYRAVNHVHTFEFTGHEMMSFGDQLAAFPVSGMASPFKGTALKVLEDAGIVTVFGYGNGQQNSPDSVIGFASPEGWCNAKTRDGDCTSPVLNELGQIVGFWTHGDGKQFGRFEPVTKEMIEFAKNGCSLMHVGMDFHLRPHSP